MVLVSVDSGTDAVDVEFGMELRRIHVSADAQDLEGAVGGGCRVTHVRRERTAPLPVPAVRVEDVGQTGEERIIASGQGEHDRDGSDRLGVRTVDGRPDNRTERAHTVTAPEKGKVAVDDATDQGQ